MPVSAPKGWYSRHYLPHFDSPGVIQTVTFRLADSLPLHIVQALEAVSADQDPEAVREQM
jgi:putative transposase